MFKNLRIGMRLGIGFGLVLVLLIAISTMAVWRVGQLNNEIGVLVDDKFPKVVVANNIIDEVNVIARALRNSALVKGEAVQKELDRVQEARKKIAGDVDKLQKTVHSEEGKKAFAKMLEAGKVYESDQDRFIELQKAGKRDEAVEFMTSRMRKTFNDYLRAVQELIDHQSEGMSKVGKEAGDMAVSTRNLIVTLAIVSALLAIGFAWWVTRTITRPVGEAVDAANRIAKGDLTVRIESHGNDEVGQLMGAMQSMLKAIQALLADAGMLSQAAVAGKLATRADASKHQGDYRKIVQGVNDTLDAVIGPLNVAADYVDRISKGDMPPKITDTYNGDFNTIKNNLNQAIEAINALVAEAKGLETAAVEGRLATRADASRYQGDYRAIVQGVNNTLDAVIGPLNVAARYVDDISKGNIPAKITDTYNGDFNTIKNNLNQAIDAVNALVADANLLAAAAVAGKLETRADASKHQGDFRKVVQGVNDTLDGVILPVNEAVSVLVEMEKGDLTRTVKGDYKGQLKDFKDTVNNTVAKLAQIIADVNATADTLASATSQVSATAQSLSQASSEQAASVEETSASIEEMSASIKQNTENAKVADTMSADGSNKAAEG
ncbi:MAG: putative methyl-accepting chemotaxis protein, partial [Rhodocyclaceae bacterium]|nr:putative methyl-accepting chemotaxis protein [Rhodocyclaceae bacterium]